MDSFERNGLVFDVHDEGPADGPVVVLLHGFPQSPEEWSEVVPLLSAQGLRCLVPTQRGYCPTARPSGRSAYRASELADDVLALAEASGADRVHLVGHDWGAAVAWTLAAAHPERISSLTALSVPHPAAYLAAVATSRQALHSWYFAAFQAPALPERLLSSPDRFARWLTASGQDPHRAARDAHRMLSSGSLTPALNWYRAVPLADPRAVRRHVTVPTTFLWSDGDTFVARSAAERCAAWVDGPYRFVELSGVSHWVPEEAPVRVAEVVAEQVRRTG